VPQLRYDDGSKKMKFTRPPAQGGTNPTTNKIIPPNNDEKLLMKAHYGATLVL
jgi:hypothetical protein